MTDDQHGEGTPRPGSRWDPLPQGDYDDGATAFVQLPEGGIDALRSDSPLAAPGHGYVPPHIESEEGQPQEVRWPDPNAQRDEPPQQPAHDGFSYHPGATGQWTFEEPAAPAQDGPSAPGHDVTGEWSIPVADGDLPDESGEYSTSALVEQWGGSPPATLPGGAAAPWSQDSWAQPEPHVSEPQAAEHLFASDEDARHAESSAASRADEAAEIIDVSGQHADEIAVSLEGHSQERASSESVSVEHEEPVEESPEYGTAKHDTQGHGTATEHGTTEHDSPEHSSQEYADEPGAESETVPQEAPEESEQAPESADGAGNPEGSAEESEDGDTPSALAHDEMHPLSSYVLRVNGVDRPVTAAWIGESLLYVLRERLGLAGAKDGCSQGECGACNVQVDGRLVASCLVPAVTTAGSEVRTVEGLAAAGQPSDVQRALSKCGAVQCGFCIPGMAMTVHDLLEGNPAPSELETRKALCGNLCRCSGYRGVLDAVREVVAEREANASAEAAQDAEEARIPHQAGPGGGSVDPSAYEASAPRQQPYGRDGGQA
ncbi:(2Fe-2S)-binding protein [Streptomyces sp. NBC_00286]|uniref:(2Fe-2S)-binding protein n=1 Tax=Streptomyces sp. NBC_00286 TaxID=2975701 RepID=UPI002E2E6150|nr:2Fe-2S iron-sulfur cluster-binding protein [Streptomyces sp. NBC_00286]